MADQRHLLHHPDHQFRTFRANAGRRSIVGRRQNPMVVRKLFAFLGYRAISEAVTCRS
jgi:hypothetical protein